MGLLARPPETDPRCKPGAYVARWGHLYEIVGLVTEGTQRGQLEAVNCADETTVYLTTVNMAAATLVRAAPEPPNAIPEAA